MLIRHSVVDHGRVFFGLRVIGLVCESGTVGKIGEVDEMGERERQGMRHDTWMTIASGTRRCAILNLEPRVFA